MGKSARTNRPKPASAAAPQVAVHRAPASPTISPPAPTPPRFDADALVQGFLHHLRYSQGKHWEGATLNDQFVSMALAVRDRIFDRKIATQSAYHNGDVKRVYYLSLEYLLGTLLRNNLVNLGLYDACKPKLAAIGVDLDALCEIEPDAGLGNGGLGRLAACFMDSLATLELPAYGYGIRYEYGIFEQTIADGWQIERPDDWLRFGSPWEVARPEFTSPVRLFGHVIHKSDAKGRFRPAWAGYRTVMALPYDIPIVGYGCNTVNLLRLWSARATAAFDLDAFNRGGYVEAVHAKALSETISKVLYPADNFAAGRELRLMQQYLFVAATLDDIMRRYDKLHDTPDALPDKVAVQLNDTHPSLAVAELMRILVDDRGVAWDKAWELTVATLGYTNHTLMPEALEMWPVDLLGRVLPRHLEIIYEINGRFLAKVVERRWPGDDAKKRGLSLVQESPVKSVRMAHLAIVGSHSINGVAALHTRLLRAELVPDFAALWPERFNNKTNGVTPRRWLRACNPDLSAAITARIGDAWVRDLERLIALEPYAADSAFCDEIRVVKLSNKRRLAAWVSRRLGIAIDPTALFDVQVKRLHEYKRQLLNIIQVVMRYQRMLIEPRRDWTPRVVLFGAKAAPAYTRAKLIIKLIHDVARVVNRDERIGDRLKVVFVPNYCVSLAERIIPAADLSEQISTAGMEASGTGNMKFSMNGALTIGTLDGANVEIREAVGPENFFLFGLTAEEVAQRKPHHDPWQFYHSCPALRDAIDAIAGGEFNPAEPGLYQPIFDWLLRDGDYYMTMADVESYVEAQGRVDELWSRPAEWDRRVVLNIARIGRFSSDRTIAEYARDVWGIERTLVSIL